MAVFNLKQVSPHVYWLNPDDGTDRPLLGVIVGSNKVMVIDAGNSPAHAELLLDELVKKSFRYPDYVVLTHWHWDHIFGSNNFEAVLVAHAETSQKIEEMEGFNWQDKAIDQRVEAGVEIELCRDMMKLEMSNEERGMLELRVPDISFEQQLTFDLGDLACEVVHVGGDHGDDCCVVYVPGDKILFLGDCLYEQLYDGDPYYTTKKLFPLIDCLLAFDVEFALHAHVDRPLTKAEFQALLGLMRQVGLIVDQHEGNRGKIKSELIKEGVMIDDDIEEMISSFINGLEK